MPPKTMKKVAPGPKRVVRTPRATKAQKKVEESVKVEEVTAEVREEVKVKVDEVVVEDKPADVPEPDTDPDERPDNEAENDLESVKKDDEIKEPVQEYEKDERLDLEDNEPEYEPEEDVGEEYDEKEEIEEEVDQEEEEEVEEEAEGDVGEEEGDGVEDEMEDVPEEHEGGRDNGEEHAVEEHANRTDIDEEEQHDVFKERRKRKEFEIFVGGLDKDATEDDLRKVFSEVGDVEEVRLMLNPQTKKNKGFAFLRFATVEQAKKACAELKNPVVNGKECGVSPSQDSDTLFLGNICRTWTTEVLKEKLKHYGVENIEDLTLVEDSNSKGLNRGFAFLEFSSRPDAMDAYKRLQRRGVTFGVDRPAKVSFADSFVDPSDDIMAQVKTVFVDGLPPSWDEDRVRDLLKKYGDIKKIELARNMPSAKRKDYGFVTFDSHDAAVTCAKSINNEELGDGGKKAKVRARLSRPLQRGKGKHASRDFRPGRAGPSRGFRAPWGRPVAPPVPVRGSRGISSRIPPVVDRGFKRSAGGFRDRRPVVSAPARGRPLPPPSRSYDRRPPVPPYPKGSLKRDYGHSHRDELPPRGRPTSVYPSRSAPERRTSYRDDYPPPSRGSAYSDLPRTSSRAAAPRRAYADDGYGQRFERPPPSYREARGRDYEPVSGSKRPYSAVDDVPPSRYADPGVRHSRARVDYELSGSGSQYGDGYSDRIGRSSLGYGSGRSSLSDTHGLYSSSSRQGAGYGGGSYGASDVGGGGGVYSSSYGGGGGGDYMSSRGSDVGGGSSYSSLYSSSRGLGGGGGSSYMGSGDSRSYY